MTRYTVRRPRAVWFDGWSDDGPIVTQISVDSAEPEPIGILDPDGNDIVRLPDPIGFVRFDR